MRLLRSMFFASLSLCLTTGLFGAEKPKPKSDDPELVAKGFKMQYFVKPPDIEYPASVAVSPSGVVFVGIDPYNVRANKSKTGRIAMCVDSTGSGTADKVTTFADNTNGPRGMCYVDHTLYVVACPTLIAYKDDGSGKAASEEVLISGYGAEPEKLAPDHSEGGVRMAIDGWLYLAVGDQGFLKAVGKDKAELQLHGGGVCRIRPDGTEFELFCRGTRNAYDISIDPLLNGFSRDNTNDGRKWNVRFAHMVQGAEYGYPSLFVNYADETLPCLADYGDGSGTGSIFIQEPYLPEGFGNTLLTCDWARGRIYWHTLEPDDSTFKVKQTEFYKGTRPTDIDVDGRGRIYVSDWRGAVYGKEKDLKKPVGFISVIQNEKGINPAEFPKLELANDRELLGYMVSDSTVLRLNAQREFLRRPFKQENADELLKALDGKAPLYARVAALFTYKQLLGVKAHPALVKVMANAELKEFAIRALADRKTQLEGLDPKPFLEALADANPRVRVQAVIALMRLNKIETAAALIPLLTDKDVEVSHLAMRALRSLKAIEVCLETASKGPSDTAAAALKALRELHDEKTVTGLARLLPGAKDEKFHGLIVDTLARLYSREMAWDGKWWGIPPDTAGPHYKNEKWEQSPAITKILSAEFDGGNDVLKAVVFKSIGRYKIPAGDLPGALAAITDTKAKLTPELAHVIVQLNEYKPEQAAQLERIATDKTFETAVRANAVEAFTRVNVDAKKKEQVTLKRNAIVNALTQLSASKETPREVFSAAARLVAGLKDFPPADFAKWAQAPNGELRESVYAALLKKKDEPPAKAAFETAWKEPADTESILNAIEKNKLSDFGEKVRSFIGDKNDGVNKAAIKAAGTQGDPAALEPLFDAAEQHTHLQDAFNALDKINTDKVDAARFATLAERAVKLAETYAGKDENLASASRMLAARYVDDKKLNADAAKAFKERLAKGGSIEPLVGEFDPSDDKRAATTEPPYKNLVQELLAIQGNKEKGREIFNTLGCIKCHTLSPKEPPKGPYLGEVGTKYKRPELIESILLPSEKIVMGYEPWLISADGESYTGFKTAETGDKFEIHLASGEFKSIQKKDVDSERKLKLSIMPNGLAAKLTHKQFANLLAYLESLVKE